MNRFADIDFSNKKLPPIYGYHTEQVVSIEKALEPIESRIDRLSHFIKIAKKHCHYPSQHGLSRDQSAAIYIYTMEWGDTSLYRILNRALRSENRQLVKIWFSYLKLFDTALDLLPTVKEVVWRGISLDIGDNFTKNQLVTWWSINSCSSSANVIENFLGNGQTSTLFLIEAMKGKKVSGYTEYENEDEVILRMGTQFCVKSNPLKQPNGTHIVHLIETDNNDDDDDESNKTLVSTMKYTDLSLSSFNNGTLVESFISRIHMNSLWTQHGIVIAGGNGKGSRLDQLYLPYGFYIDDVDQSIYIADWGNHRIINWKSNEKTGKVIAGGNGQGNRTNQLNQPTDVIIDIKNDSLIICDYGNKRIVEWSRQNDTKSGKILISDIDCWSLTMDKHGHLYVSDYKNNEVRQWKRGQTNGTIVAGGNRQGNQLDQLNFPTHIFVDENDSVYVSDYRNHRVMKWIKNAKEGIVVAGGNGEGSQLTQLDHPNGVIVDHLDNVYLADCYNYRIVCWSKGAKEGRLILGGNGEGGKKDQFNCPTGLLFDREDNLYVVDYGNHRVQKFRIINWNPDDDNDLIIL